MELHGDAVRVLQVQLGVQVVQLRLARQQEAAQRRLRRLAALRPPATASRHRAARPAISAILGP